MNPDEPGAAGVVASAAPRGAPADDRRPLPSVASLAPAAAAAAVAVAVKPRLRGWSHVVCAPVALAGAIVLVLAATGDPGRQLGLLTYGLAAALLFSVSGAYHVVQWSPPRRLLMRRLDRASIFLLIAGTYTPVCLTVLDEPWRAALLGTVWGWGLLGIVTLVALPKRALGASTRVRRGVAAVCYLGQGWVAVVGLPALYVAVGAGGLALLLLGGVLYSLGAVAYASRRPRLRADTFGYHEVFHVLVIAANAAFFTFMLVIVVPHHH